MSRVVLGMVGTRILRTANARDDLLAVGAYKLWKRGTRLSSEECHGKEESIYICVGMSGVGSACSG